jgi:hypothetical protein
MEDNLIDIVANAIRKEFYGSDDSQFGHKEARAAILAIKEWLHDKETHEVLAFLFPAVDLLEEELKK